jgi:ornithine cyclodeaminase/alanine dehydrogenase-like protein (mu-crystallin family)
LSWVASSDGSALIHPRFTPPGDIIRRHFLERHQVLEQCGPLRHQWTALFEKSAATGAVEQGVTAAVAAGEAPTGSTEILVRGEWIRPGTHTDFLGNHHATKRECDTAMVTRSRVFVDTRVNCFKEAGEILVPVAEGVFSTDQVAGELSELCRGSVPPRRNGQEITLFKSVGCALGDLCGALGTFRATER